MVIFVETKAERRIGLEEELAKYAEWTHLKQSLGSQAGPPPHAKSRNDWYYEMLNLGHKEILIESAEDLIVAGLGNIYVCEALYRARISPLVAAGKISKPRLETLERHGEQRLADAALEVNLRCAA